MRGGYEMTSTCIQGGLPRPLGGFQPNMIMEPRSPASAWQYNSLVPKQEPMEEERNDSGINSGSDFHSSSPGSENSQDIVAYSSSNHNQRPVNTQPFYSTPVLQRNPNFPLGFSQPMHLVYNQNSDNTANGTPSTNENQDVDKSQDLSKNEPSSPCRSPGQDLLHKNNQESEDALKRLQMSLEKNGFLPSSLSPKASENSVDEDAKSDNDIDEFDENGLRIPRVNSHGKVKTFKCKQCDFVAITKLDFWEHTKNHIKADKLLTCPKCPFVTEYKHHLEYHLRNHFGSKPFKCDKCSYSCVNKSMLNSHLKSHSNIYQYRCADCSYATKYCHSLKLHLRKYGHNPAMVLNPDGSPNPLPIIDVYGTRRGPKVKSNSFSEDEIKPPPTKPTPEMALPYHLQQLMMSPPQMQLPFPYPWFPNAVLFQNLEKLARAQTSPSHDDDNPQRDVPPQQEVLDLRKQDGEAASKSRRKGRAFKLDNLQANSSDDEEVAEEGTTTVFTNVEVVHKDSGSDKEDEEVSNNNNNKSDLSCQFCTISFGDPVLYTMHMGYHGFDNPFSCNMCGQKCEDKVSFFLHIARTSHN